MIIIGLGANLTAPGYDTPLETLKACVDKLKDYQIRVVKCSRWYESAPVPASDQPWYINGCVHVQTSLSPRSLLETLLKVEQDFGRVRNGANAPRILDLDLLAYDTQIIEDNGKIEDKPFCIPHPRLHERAFTLYPIRDLDPGWQHPKSHQSLDIMIQNLPADQDIACLE